MLERTQDVMGVLAIHIHKYYELVRWRCQSLIPGGLDQPFSHLHVKRPVSRWNTNLVNDDAFGSKVRHEVRNGTALRLTRRDDDDVLIHHNYPANPFVW